MVSLVFIKFKVDLADVAWFHSNPRNSLEADRCFYGIYMADGSISSLYLDVIYDIPMWPCPSTCLMNFIKYFADVMPGPTHFTTCYLIA